MYNTIVQELILSSDHFYKGTYVKSMKICTCMYWHAAIKNPVCPILFSARSGERSARVRQQPAANKVRGVKLVSPSFSQYILPNRDQGCKDHDVWTQRDFIQKSQVIVETHESQNFSSLEDSQPSSPEVYVDPLRTIR